MASYTVCAAPSDDSELRLEKHLVSFHAKKWCWIAFEVAKLNRPPLRCYSGLEFMWISIYDTALHRAFIPSQDGGKKG